MKAKLRIGSCLVACAGMLLAGCNASPGYGAPASADDRRASSHLTVPSPTGTPTLTVDFSKPAHVESQAGFLHGYQTNIQDALLTPLQPALWRFDLPYEDPGYQKVERLFPSLRIIDVLSDDYGYPFTGNWNFNGNPNPPYDRAPYAGKGVPAWVLDRRLCGRGIP